jgi:type I restriction enzyme S subunit
MPKNWKTYKLSEALEIKYGKDHKKVSDGDIPIYGTGGIMRFGNQFLYDDESILIPRKGSLNNIYYLNKPFWTVDTLFWSKINKEIVFPKYLFYNLKILDFANMDVGTAIPSLTTKLLNKIEVNIPPLPEQKAIANILSTIDDKIENNLAVNKTLEDMAMALYKHWFVDFGPFQDGEFIDSELGLIPKGWEVKYIKELFAIKPINGLYKKKEFQGSGNRWLKMKSVYGIDIITNEDMELIQVNKKEVNKYGCKKNDIVFGRTSLVLEGIGTCAIIKSNINIAVFESNLFRFRFDENLVIPDLMFLFFKSPTGRENVKKLARQTAAVSITSSDVSEIKIALPNIEKQMEFGSQIERFIEKIVSNKEENQSLTKLRDTLLPKLISGEVRLKEFQEEIENVM